MKYVVFNGKDSWCSDNIGEIIEHYVDYILDIDPLMRLEDVISICNQNYLNKLTFAQVTDKNIEECTPEIKAKLNKAITDSYFTKLRAAADSKPERWNYWLKAKRIYEAGLEEFGENEPKILLATDETHCCCKGHRCG